MLFLLFENFKMGGKTPIGKSYRSTQSQSSKTPGETGKYFNKRARMEKEITRKKTRKVTKLVSVVTLNFAICWLPANFFIILIVFVDKLDSEFIKHYLYLFKLFAHTLSYLTPVLNPISYAFYNDKFRGPLKHICRRIFYDGDSRYRPAFEGTFVHHTSTREKAETTV